MNLYEVLRACVCVCSDIDVRWMRCVHEAVFEVKDRQNASDLSVCERTYSAPEKILWVVEGCCGWCTGGVGLHAFLMIVILPL